MAGVTDLEIHTLKDKIGANSKLVDLGLHLGMKSATVDMYVQMNHPGGKVTSDGTRALLLSWAEEAVPKATQCSVLKTALEKAGLAGIAEEVFGDHKSPSPPQGSSSSSGAGNKGEGSQIHQSGATINVTVTGGSASNINITGQQATINK